MKVDRAGCGRMKAQKIGRLLARKLAQPNRLRKVQQSQILSSRVEKGQRWGCELLSAVAFFLAFWIVRCGVVPAQDEREFGTVGCSDEAVGNCCLLNGRLSGEKVMKFPHDLGGSRE